MTFYLWKPDNFCIYKEDMRIERKACKMQIKENKSDGE